MRLTLRGEWRTGAVVNSRPNANRTAMYITRKLCRQRRSRLHTVSGGATGREEEGSIPRVRWFGRYE